MSAASAPIKAKREIAWSPHGGNEFVVGGADLRYYSLTYKNESTLLRRNANAPIVASQIDVGGGGPNTTVTGDQKWLTLHLINAELPSFRCLTWSPPTYSPICLAVGQSNGRVAIASRSALHAVSVQFVPRGPERPCNQVAWNDSITGYLAAALNRHRGDYSTIIWDVSQYAGGANANNAAVAAASVTVASSALPELDGDVDYLDDPVAAEQRQVSRQRSQPSAAAAAAAAAHAAAHAAAESANSNNSSNTVGSTASTSSAATMSSVDNVFDAKPHEADHTVNKPLYELVNSESALAIEWLPDMPTCIAVGVRERLLRIVDLRGGSSTGHSVVAHEKGVYCVTFDPFHSRRLATYSDDGVVFLWDMRRLVEPTHTLTVGSKPLQSIKWCPTRSGILATQSRDENCVKLFDLKARFELPRSQSSDASVGLFTTPSGSTRLLPRTVTAKRGVSSFSWHPTNEDLVITVSEEAVVELITLSKPISLGLSPTGQLAFVHERQVVITPTTVASVDMYIPPAPDSQPLPWIDDNAMRATGGALNGDIALVIRARARLNYGMDVAHNAELVRPWKDHPKLRALWGWMHSCVRADEAAELARLEASSDDEASGGSDTAAPTVSAELRAKRRFMGVLSLLYDSDASPEKSPPPPPDEFSTAPLFTVRVSPQRQRCLDHIGWFSSARLDETLRRAEEAGEYERAAAIAVFFMDLKKAIQILYRAQTARSRNVDDNAATTVGAAADTISELQLDGGNDDMPPPLTTSLSSVDPTTSDLNLKLVAMALAGYEGGVLWRQTCRSLMNQLKHPYLQACFAFLCAERREKHFKTVLSTEISLRDKLGFAMRYLDDPELHRFVDRRTAAAVRMGDLEGILLTGLASNRAVDLLQSYVNRTADVQTACLAVSHVVPLVFEDERVRRWVESYRDILDRWGMWQARAAFDTQRVPFTDQRMPPQIYVRCSSCGQSLTVGSTSGKSAGMRGAAQRRPEQQRLKCCPFCAKPLPRCAVCLLALSGALPGTQHRHGDNLRGGWQTADVPFDEWFTWCQACKHGGHAGHILQWFKEHERCPVTSCECKCGSI